MTMIRADQIMSIYFDNQTDQEHRLFHHWKSCQSGNPNHGNQANQEKPSLP